MKKRKIRTKTATPTEGLKVKVHSATEEAVHAVAAITIAKMEAATVGELQAALMAIAESFVGLTAECPEKLTKYGLALAFVSQVLDEAAGATSLQDALKNMAPPETRFPWGLQ